MAETTWKNPINDTDFEKGLVERLADRPNSPSAYGQGGLSPTALKKWFDNSARTLQRKLNDMIAALGGDDALSDISVLVDGEVKSAKEWIESIIKVELGDEVITLTEWVDRLAILIDDVKNDMLSEDEIEELVDNKLENLDIGASVELSQTLDRNETDKAPSVKAVNDGLAGKVDLVTERANNPLLYGVKKGVQEMIPTHKGNVVDYIPIYLSKNDKTADADYMSGVLMTGYPTKKYHCANMRYVDDEIAEMAEALRAELGKTIQIKSVSGDKYDGWQIPDGALPNFYLPTTDFEYDATDGNRHIASFTHISFYNDTSPEPISTMVAQADTYYGTPSGAVRIDHNAVEMNDNGLLDPSHDISGSMYMPDLIFQVEV